MNPNKYERTIRVSTINGLEIDLIMPDDVYIVRQGKTEVGYKNTQKAAEDFAASCKGKLAKANICHHCGLFIKDNIVWCKDEGFIHSFCSEDCENAFLVELDYPLEEDMY
jgi:hypothetical protein